MAVAGPGGVPKMPAVDPLALVQELIAAGPICDHCLGTRLAGWGHGLTARQRGELVRALLGAGKVPGASCWVCGGAFQRVSEWAAQAAKLAAPYEHHTFLFGVKLSPRLQATQEFLDHRFPSPQAEPVRRELNRELGRHYERLLGREVTVDFRRPDLRFTLDLETGTLQLQVASVYFYGRYRKLVRGIPQTHWPCRACQGRGCEQCQFTGKQYPTSVEELILPVFVQACAGEGGHLHGAGREDVDARMLGRGRPFVLEVKAPRHRNVDLAEITRLINETAQGKIEVRELQPASPELVEQVKALKAKKLYRAKVRFSQPVGERELEQAAQGLVGEIAQRTPTRVSHRRADLVRQRRVYQVRVHRLSPSEAELEILCDGGLYVKELISGDEGRTRPSLAELLGTPTQVVELDVLEVLDELEELELRGTEPE